MDISASSRIPATAIPAEKVTNNSTEQATLLAVQQSQAIAWFDPEGYVIEVNGKFGEITGFASTELVGRHHSSLLSNLKDVDIEAFWQDMRAGQTRNGEMRLLGKGGVGIWLEAAHVPVLSTSRQLEKVGMFAFDISARKLAKSDYADQMQAIAKSHAVIEFDLDGFILSADLPLNFHPAATGAGS